MRPDSSKLILTLAAGCLLAADGLVATPALGQSLSDRINHARQVRSREGADGKGQMLGVLLYTDLTLQLNDTPAREAIDYLKTALGLNIVGRYNDDRTGIGIDPDTEINIDVTNKNALTVLEMILAQCGDEIEEAAWQLRDGFVEIGTKERLSARSAQETRYYPIRDLLFEPPRYDNSPDLDLDSALSQGQGGGQGGGGGGGGGFGGGGGGGSGGGGSGGGGGGSLIGGPADDPQRPTEIEQAQQLVDLIMEIVEPDAWVDNGGEYATIRYYQGTLIIRAPDYIQRQIGGYPSAVRPTGGSAGAAGPSRYVTFTGGLSEVQLAELKSRTVGGAAGGN